MPATYTHHIFTNDVFKSLDDTVKKRLDSSIQLFYLFGKSFDNLFFSKTKLGYYAHGNNSNLYFRNIVKYMKENALENDGDILAYLYGAICHYVLDSTIHPYVYYKAGQYRWNQETLKYRGKHSYVETMMDAALYEHVYNSPIYKANFRKEFPSNLKFSDNLRDIMNYVFVNTFDYEVEKKVSTLYYKGYKNFMFVLKHGMASRFGFKMPIYRLADKLKLYKKGPLVNFCYYVKKIDYSVLNLEHKEWNHPSDKNITFHYSFYDLYDIAILKARDYINDLDLALRGEKDLEEALNAIGNLSYYTGLDASESHPLKYFEY